MGYKGIVMTSWSTSGAYSYLYESDNSPIDLYAIRHVYPVTGFNILLAAYITSINSTPPLDIEGFVTNYCAVQYGFTAKQAALFWQALKAAPYEVKNGVVQSATPVSLSLLADSVTYAANVFKTLTPFKKSTGVCALPADGGYQGAIPALPPNRKTGQ